MIVSVRDLSIANYIYSAHLNMGFDREEGSIHYGKQLGFGYLWRCEEFPRVYLIDRHYLVPHRHISQHWYVDGEEAPDMGAAAQALSRPPVLTLTAFWALQRMLPRTAWKDCATRDLSFTEAKG